jgi:hypothetical protein
MMRQILLMSVVLAGAGCHCLGGRDCGTAEDETCRPRHFAGLHRRAPVCEKPCEETKKPVGKPPETPKAAQPEDITRAVVAQEVLLVPKTVYMPYVAQTPVSPVRMAGPGAPAPPPEKPFGKPPEEEKPELRQMLDLCKKLCERIDRMEKCIGERQPVYVPAPEPGAAPPCPPTCPTPGILPLFRRPAFQNCEPLFTCPPATQPTAPAPRETLPTAPKKLGSS